MMATKQPSSIGLDFDADFWQSSYEYLESERPSLIASMTRLIKSGVSAEEVRQRARRWTANKEYLAMVYSAALHIQTGREG